MEVTREQVVENLELVGLEWGDEEDAKSLVDLLSEAFTPTLAWCWLAFWCDELRATPLVLLETGRRREVFAEARRIVAERSLSAS